MVSRNAQTVSANICYISFIYSYLCILNISQLSKIKLLLEGADKDAFSVVPEVITSESTVELLVKQPQKLDFEEKQQIVLQVSNTEKKAVSL